MLRWQIRRTASPLQLDRWAEQERERDQHGYTTANDEQSSREHDRLGFAVLTYAIASRDEAGEAAKR